MALPVPLGVMLPVITGVRLDDAVLDKMSVDVALRVALDDSVHDPVIVAEAVAVYVVVPLTVSEGVEL